ncbi:TetR family transcriptional regulator [Streptomyces sp. Tu 6176]|uniref:TetR/AcrR family transcriptional regulator n=1 Tax=Streptomyces sp. Tu 6176 TaxID=1470557 RepID=UPI00044D0E2A|nr:TetR family transcriptional regulator [Streptomyces sp. Tu 6176]EYT82028.1 TetR family transcriptional regulator [Streptomyces sp. Tu 6176]
MSEVFQRARSAEAKQARELTILSAARALAAERGVRDITLTDIATAIGMHKSALLRYFETREQIFLSLSATEWRMWTAEVCRTLGSAGRSTPSDVARVLAATLVARPLFCDLLAHTPLNLERNVSVDAVRSFKTSTLHQVDLISTELRRLLGLSRQQAVDTVATATGMAGALWHMSTPGEQVRELYECELKDAVVDLEPQLRRILSALLSGACGQVAA